MGFDHPGVTSAAAALRAGVLLAVAAGLTLAAPVPAAGG